MRDGAVRSVQVFLIRASDAAKGQPMRARVANRKGRSRQRRVVHRELLQIDGRSVEMSVKLNPRARRLIVKVHPTTGEVSVTAPSKRALDRAVEFARGERDWIARQLARVPSRVVLVPGVRIPFRGEDHLILRDADERGVTIDEDKSIIRVGGRAEHAPRRLQDFLKRRARLEVETRSFEFAARIGAKPRRVTVRDTASRWGSCSTTRSLSYSWRLILAPPFVLDYVVAHEVAHLREMNHGASFWRLVRELVGDVKRPQAWLRQHGVSLHRYAPR
ncbi:MAG: M48 family metallopeptidase [Alphaproteobacteria bacterium]|nr:M48 family metallopeptidase [Alphaproteobacteria bacterium]